MPTTTPLARRRRRRAPRRPMVPSRENRHLLSRFSYGVTQQLVGDMRALGGAEQWFARQLYPGRIADPYAKSLREWWPHLDKSAQEKYHLHRTDSREGWEQMADFVRWTLLRRIYSKRQLQEVMTEFWSNLLHVPAPSDKAWPHRVAYDTMIRSHALGRFDQMLYASVTHPSMGCYLDNAKSTREAPNENLGRELLELHTVGRMGGYGERDVLDSARILTGWKVDMFDTWKATYEPDDHYVGPVRVMDFYSANSSRDGRELTRKYVTYLAHHPATARRIARRLAVRFVSDDPPADLVTSLSRAYLGSRTDIKATLRELVRHPAFARSVGQKVRTPSEDLIATYRVLGVGARKSTDGRGDLSNAIIWQSEGMGEKSFSWPTPDGPPDVGDAWASASRMLMSWSTHLNLAGGYWPSTGVDYRTPQSFLPPLPARFDQVVDHLARRLHAKPGTPHLVAAMSTAIDVGARERITRDHALVRWRMPRLLQAMLDTPRHMTR